MSTWTLAIAIPLFALGCLLLYEGLRGLRKHAEDPEHYDERGRYRWWGH